MKKILFISFMLLLAVTVIFASKYNFTKVPGSYEAYFQDTSMHPNGDTSMHPSKKGKMDTSWNKKKGMKKKGMGMKDSMMNREMGNDSMHKGMGTDTSMMNNGGMDTTGATPQ